MSDLQEIRRFWPKAVSVRLHGHKICVQPSKGSKFTLTKPHVWWCIADQRGGLWTYYERPTLAAAMAAAGFGERPEGKFAYAKRQQHYWRTPEGYDPFVTLEGRQRQRKGVRLGTRQRRAAFGKSLDDAIERVKLRRLLGLVDQLRALDRGGIGG